MESFLISVYLLSMGPEPLVAMRIGTVPSTHTQRPSASAWWQDLQRSPGPQAEILLRTLGKESQKDPSI